MSRPGSTTKPDVFGKAASKHEGSFSFPRTAVELYMKTWACEGHRVSAVLARMSRTTFLCSYLHLLDAGRTSQPEFPQKLLGHTSL